ncbi:hypothetical protein GPX89_30440 [Nocardia sp. ET3-3]|uniref:Uncharacterized protein n=1 Tax=Nocardia terrae TaxID=2675851 RepID=A0A7K1V4T1_9NOCA|nr:hypothetical protein [Nocardia terrae]
MIAAVLTPLAVIGYAAKTGWADFVAMGATVFAALFVLTGLGSLRYRGRNRAVRLDLFESGFVATRGEGLRVVRYANTAVRQRIVHYVRTNETYYRYWVTDINGATLLLRENFVDPQQWGPAIQVGVTDVQWPDVWADLESGRRVEFGSLWLSNTEIGSDRYSEPWAEIKQIKIAPNRIRIDVEGKPGLPGPATETVPNVYLFRAVADRLCSIHGRAGVVTQ